MEDQVDHMIGKSDSQVMRSSAPDDGMHRWQGDSVDGEFRCIGTQVDLVIKEIRCTSNYSPIAEPSM